MKALIRLAVPPEASDDAVEEASKRWKRLYPEYGYKLTRPYPGIERTLGELKERGVKLAVLSNKFDGATKEVIEAFLPGFFDRVQGESPDYPRKPDPTGLNKLLAELDVPAQRCVFVGDSSNDTGVARAAGAYAVGRLGYNDTALLKESGAELVIDRPDRCSTRNPKRAMRDVGGVRRSDRCRRTPLSAAMCAACLICPFLVEWGGWYNNCESFVFDAAIPRLHMGSRGFAR